MNRALLTQQAGRTAATGTNDPLCKARQAGPASAQPSASTPLPTSPSDLQPELHGDAMGQGCHGHGTQSRVDCSSEHCAATCANASCAADLDQRACAVEIRAGPCAADQPPTAVADIVSDFTLQSQQGMPPVSGKHTAAGTSKGVKTQPADRSKLCGSRIVQSMCGRIKCTSKASGEARPHTVVECDPRDFEEAMPGADSGRMREPDDLSVTQLAAVRAYNMPIANAGNMHLPWGRFCI
jgi:hypothetical protein